MVRISDDVWDAGAEAVAREIERIEARYLAQTIREDIGVSASGRLTLIPQPFKETEHLGKLLDVVRDTLELATENASNGLSKDCYQARLIDRTLARYSNDPQRIEMDLERAKVSLLQDIADDSIPASPANRDLVQALGDATGSIRESDPEIAASRERLIRIRLRNLSPEQGQQIAEVALAVAEESEDALRVELLEDRFRFPGVHRNGVPDPVVPLGGAERNATLEAQAAQVRVASRLAKIWLYGQENPGTTFNYVAGLASIISLILTLFV